MRGVRANLLAASPSRKTGKFLVDLNAALSENNSSPDSGLSA
jgi:hypothetical protein